MSISSKRESKELAASNSNRMYTPEEDQEILDYWWDKNARPELCRRLGRTQAAVAQRFYAIVKARNIDPKKYRQEKRRLAKESLTAERNQKWTNAEEMRLWRLVKSGMSLEEASQQLGRPVAACMRKLSQLKVENQALETEADIEELKEATHSAQHGISFEVAEEVSQPEAEERFFSEAEFLPEQQARDWKAEVSKQATASASLPSNARGDDDILETLKDFPRQVREIEARLADLEKENQLLRENMEFVLEEVAQGLKNTGGFLSDQKAQFTAFQQLKEEKIALQQELESLRSKMEEEKRELRKTYQEIDFWLGEFLKLRKIEKVASLSDLIPKLKYSYDRFGVLLNINHE